MEGQLGRTKCIVSPHRLIPVVRRSSHEFKRDEAEYVKAEPISLKGHPDFSEVWLHDQICKDPSILGLGDLTVIERERVQVGAGRLDMLLSDADAESTVRYEVEIMLGPTDPSHIIRTIEYWDIERHRYPAYDHITVLVAEQVPRRQRTARRRTHR